METKLIIQNIYSQVKILDGKKWKFVIYYLFTSDHLSSFIRMLEEIFQVFVLQTETFRTLYSVSRYPFYRYKVC